MPLHQKLFPDASDRKGDRIQPDDSKPRYIRSRLRVMTDYSHLDAAMDITQYRLPSAGEAASKFDPWVYLDQTCLLSGFPNDISRQRSRRVMIVADSGIGKTTLLEWVMAWKNNLADGDLALVVPLREVGNDVERFWKVQLLDSLREAYWKDQSNHGLDMEKLVADIEITRDRGQLWLAFDSVDQAGTVDGPTIKQIIDQVTEPGGRILITTRPYMWPYLKRLAREQDLKFDQQWTFVRINEFDEDKQMVYLGKVVHNQQVVWRYDLINPAAHEMLRIPRILQELRNIEPEKLGALSSASHVLYEATKRIVHEAHDQWQKGNPGKNPPLDVPQTHRILATLAFQMMRMGNPPRLEEDTGTDDPEPNFGGLPVAIDEHGTGQLEVNYLLKRVREQTTGDNDDKFNEQVEWIAASGIVSNGVFDSFRATGKLQRVIFLNRSL